MRILVTGGAGFIGSHVVDLLISRGHDVLVVDDLSTGKKENISPYVKRSTFSILLLEQLWECFEIFKPRAVMHLAAQASISNSYLDSCNDLSINGMGTLNVLRCAVQAEVEDFVFASTSAVYADSSKPLKETGKLAEPGTPYGVSKRAAEQYVRIFFPNAVVLRLGNVYGPRQVPIGENQLVARLIRHFQTREKFEVFGDGEQKRDFVYVEDVARAFYSGLSAKGGTYNIAYGEAVSVNDAARLMAQLWGFPSYEFKHDLGRHDNRRNVCMNISMAMRDMRWDPIVSLEEGMQKTIEWWEKRPIPKGQPC